MIYFIITECENIVKIGVTTDVEKRFESIQTVSPLPVKIAAVCDGGLKAEKALHKHFAYCNCHHEWFYVEQELKCLIEYVIKNEKLPTQFIIEDDVNIIRAKINELAVCGEYVFGDSIYLVSRRHGITRDRCRRILYKNGVPLRTWKAPKSQILPKFLWDQSFSDGDVDIYMPTY